MAIQTINIGSSANDGTGDPLRTAFDKVNDNFVELYAVTGAGSGQNLAISANSLISENTNGSITIDPNGTGTIIFAADSAVSGTTASTSATSGSFTAAGGAGIAADLHVGDDVTLISDAAVLGFGADKDVTFTHVADTGLLLNSTRTIQFNDASQNIGAPNATTLDINATDEVEINATLIDVNGNLDVSGTIVGATTLSAATITATTAFVPDASDGAALGTTALEFSDLFLADASTIQFGADQDVTLTHVADTGILINAASKLQFRDSALSINSSADGQLDIDADTEVEITTALVEISADATIGDDLTLISDASVLGFGVNKDVTLTHVHDTGLLLNSTMKLQFNDATQFVQGISATVLGLGATDEIDLTATAVDINGTVAISGDTTFETGADIITASAGTSNVRIGVNAGNAIESGGTLNTVVGDESGTSITTGDENSLFGFVSGDAITTGIRNVAVGSYALSTNVAGDQSVAVGHGALFAQNPSGNVDMNNVAVGHDAGNQITTGVENTIVGGIAGDALTVGNNNTAVGKGALTTDTKGSNSTALGYNALQTQNFTSATDTGNVAVGHFAGTGLTTGLKNSLVGALTGDALTDADFNTALGFQALTADTLGSGSTGIGFRALATQNFTSATDSANTAIGYNAGVGITSGTLNTLIGAAGGQSITSGGGNVIVGQSVGVAATSHTIVMGNGVTTTGQDNFTFGRSNTDSNIAFGGTSVSAPSDIRLKEDIQDEKIGLDFINELRPVTFQWKKAKDVPSEMKAHSDSEERVMNGKYNHGFIAQEVKSVLDRYDIKDGFGMWLEDEADGRQRIAEAELMSILVKAVQELSAEVKKLKGE